ncbi:MAG: ATP-dependent zinc metalloprotease FtsH [Candidatus Gracilibacteria bacterium]|nr:ATP-dependent zinc metalloprotease FtsH [Candidatus Gracilibacteria bacterium]
MKPKKTPSKTPSNRNELLKAIKTSANQQKGKKWNPVAMLILISLFIAGYYFFVPNSPKEIVNDKIGINQVVAQYLSGSYSEIIVLGESLQAKKPERTETVGNKSVAVVDIDKVMLPPKDSLKDLGFNVAGVATKITVKDDVWGKFIANVLPTLLLFILLIAGFMLFMGKMGGGANGPMAFIKSRAKIYEPGKDKITFNDVAGSVEEKEDLAEVVDFLKNPKKFLELGAKIPRGILMVGPPGTGKTLLARAVAGESNVPFFSISGSEFVEMFVGVGASRVRDLFKEAKERAPSIIFIDEIDAIGKKRSPGIGGGHDEREQTLNQILTEMDGFENDTSVIILAATNRADVLDKALLRPGRFDRKVTINLPNLEDRIKILEVHAKGKPLAKDIDMRKIASSTVGFAGADLGNLLNESAILAGRMGSKIVTQAMIQQSIEKVLMGNTKKSSRMTELEKKITAYHEVGHALVGKMTPFTDSVHKVSIIPRGGAGGVTWFLPEKDRTYVTKAKYLDELATLYGGRVAEEVFFGSDMVTTGASSDIERATEIARAMVMRYGFDEELGAENFASDSIEGNYLGAEGGGKLFSEKTQEKIDEKVRLILRAAYERARHIITEYRSLHEKIAEVLLKKEELLAQEFDEFFEGVSVPNKAAI